MSCPLCAAPDGTVLWHDDFCRVIRADEPDYPGFLRVILNAHVKEMTDLPPAEREAVMRVVFAAETALREVMAPDKVNLASLGNVVPHLHWHILPRYIGDPRWGSPIWLSSLADMREVRLEPRQQAALVAELRGALAR